MTLLWFSRFHELTADFSIMLSQKVKLQQNFGVAGFISKLDINTYSQPNLKENA